MSNQLEKLGRQLDALTHDYKDRALHLPAAGTNKLLEILQEQYNLLLQQQRTIISQQRSISNMERNLTRYLAVMTQAQRDQVSPVKNLSKK